MFPTILSKYYSFLLAPLKRYLYYEKRHFNFNMTEAFYRILHLPKVHADASIATVRYKPGRNYLRRMVLSYLLNIILVVVATTIPATLLLTLLTKVYQIRTTALIFKFVFTVYTIVLCVMILLAYIIQVLKPIYGYDISTLAPISPTSGFAAKKPELPEYENFSQRKAIYLEHMDALLHSTRTYVEHAADISAANRTLNSGISRMRALRTEYEQTEYSFNTGILRESLALFRQTVVVGLYAALLELIVCLAYFIIVEYLPHISAFGSVLKNAILPFTFVVPAWLICVSVYIITKYLLLSHDIGRKANTVCVKLDKAKPPVDQLRPILSEAVEAFELMQMTEKATGLNFLSELLPSWEEWLENYRESRRLYAHSPVTQTLRAAREALENADSDEEARTYFQSSK